MNEIKIAESKTLKLTNVFSREIRPEEANNLSLIVTQMHIFIKSHNAQPIGPLVQSVTPNPDREGDVKVTFMQQATQFIPQTEPGCHMDAVLRVKNCLYAHYDGPMSHSRLADWKLQIYAFEHDLTPTGAVYTIYVNSDSDDAVIDTFMEIK